MRRFSLFISLITLALLGSSVVFASTDTQNITVELSVPQTGGGQSSGGGPSGPGGTTDQDPDPDPTTDNAPTISNVVVTKSNTNATIAWEATDDNGIDSNVLEFGLTTDYGSSAAVSGSFSATLSSLTADTTYFYKITVTDTADQTTTETGSFTTATSDTVAPTITGLVVELSETSATITWSTNEVANSEVLYGTTAEYGQSKSSASLVTSHSLDLPNLLPNTTYHFKAVSTDAAGNSANSSDKTFTIASDSVAPPDVSSLGVSSVATGLFVSWLNPNLTAVPDFSGVTVLKTTGQVSTGLGDGTVIYTGLAQSITDTNAVEGITYYYLVLSFDTSSNYSPGVSAFGSYTAPSVVVGPEICDNSIDDDNNGLVDCADSACSEALNCQAVSAVEICTNGVDDDNNGLVDCADNACVGFIGCSQSTTDPETSSPELPSTPAGEPSFTPQPSTVGGSSQVQSAQLQFLAGGRAIVLNSRNGEVSVLAGFPFTVVLPQQKLLRNPESISVVLGNTSRHQFVYSGVNNNYSADLTAPSGGSYLGFVEIDYGNDEYDTISFVVNSLPWGDVSVDGTRLPGVKITLQDTDRNPVAMDLYAQSNPLATNPNGIYGFMVPNGRYLIVAKKEGYFDRKTAGFGVKNNIVNKQLQFIAKPQPILAAINPASSTVENAAAVTKQVIKQTQVVAKRIVQKAAEVANDPAVEETASDVVVPTVVVATAVGTAAFITWLDLLPLLRLLFLQPLMLLGLRRRKGWGQVYNSLNKLPVDLATLRLIDAKSGKLLQTKVTDKKGRFAFVVKQGAYRILATKGNLIFPSELLKSFSSDGRRTDVYHGEMVEVEEKGAVLTMNIPLDPIGQHDKPRRLVWQRIGRALQVTLSWVGLIVTLVSLYISPRWYVWALLGVHLLLFIVFRRLAIPPKIKGWGIVYDTLNKKPIGRVVARLFNSQFNKLVSTQITDGRGRYYFLAGDDKYFVTYHHNAYTPHKTNTIDLGGKEEENITVDIGLKKSAGDMRHYEEPGSVGGRRDPGGQSPTQAPAATPAVPKPEPTPAPPPQPIPQTAPPATDSPALPKPHPAVPPPIEPPTEPPVPANKPSSPALGGQAEESQNKPPESIVG